MRGKNLVGLTLLSTSISACALLEVSGELSAEFTDCESCPEMVKIPTGSYVMGDSIGGGRSNERPLRPISINTPFAISKFPVTIKQFQAFVSATDYVTEAERSPAQGCWGIREDVTIGWLPSQHWNNNRLNQTENHPVVCVSWNDANNYVQWLSVETGFNYRLPSEAEWEYAARAGSEGKYYFGDDEQDVCEYINHADYQMIKSWNADTGVSACDDGFLYTSPVGTYPANNFGLYDVYGNVWEWVADCYQPHLQELRPELPASSESSCDKHTLRGASWAARPEGITTSYRISGEPHGRTVDHGFRVVRELDSN